MLGTGKNQKTKKRVLRGCRAECAGPILQATTAQPPTFQLPMVASSSSSLSLLSLSLEPCESPELEVLSSEEEEAGSGSVTCTFSGQVGKSRPAMLARTSATVRTACVKSWPVKSVIGSSPLRSVSFLARDSPALHSFRTWGRSAPMVRDTPWSWWSTDLQKAITRRPEFCQRDA